MRFIKISSTGEQLPPDATGHIIVADPAAKLEWAVVLLCSGEEVTYQQAIEACAALDLGSHKDWRLPSVEELFLLADRTKYDPAIDTDFFPDTPSDFHWSSAPYAGAPVYAWGVLFYSGDSGIAHRNDYGFVRAVRSVLPASPSQ